MDTAVLNTRSIFYNCFVTLKTRHMTFFLFKMKANPDLVDPGIL